MHSKRSMEPGRIASSIEPEPDAGSAADEMLAALEDVIMEYASGLVDDNLEGLQFLLRKLDSTAEARPQLSGTLRRWTQTLQQKIAEHWGGLPLSLQGLL